MNPRERDVSTDSWLTGTSAARPRTGALHRVAGPLSRTRLGMTTAAETRALALLIEHLADAVDAGLSWQQAATRMAHMPERPTGVTGRHVRAAAAVVAEHGRRGSSLAATLSSDLIPGAAALDGPPFSRQAADLLSAAEQYGGTSAALRILADGLERSDTAAELSRTIRTPLLGAALVHLAATALVLTLAVLGTSTSWMLTGVVLLCSAGTGVLWHRASAPASSHRHESESAGVNATSLLAWSLEHGLSWPAALTLAAGTLPEDSAAAWRAAAENMSLATAPNEAVTAHLEPGPSTDLVLLALASPDPGAFLQRASQRARERQLRSDARTGARRTWLAVARAATLSSVTTSAVAAQLWMCGLLR